MLLLLFLFYFMQTFCLQKTQRVFLQIHKKVSEYDFMQYVNGIIGLKC